MRRSDHPGFRCPKCSPTLIAYNNASNDMRRRLAFGFALALVTVGGTLADVGSTSSSAPPRIIDRTLLCMVTERGGARVLTVAADTGGFERVDPATGEKSRELPSFAVWSGLGFANGISVGNLVSAAAGQVDGYVWIGDPSKCVTAKNRVRLTAGRLEGGRASQLGDEYDCLTPRRILVRIRAVFRGPTALRRNARYRLLMARGSVIESYLAIRTPGGKPLVFASASQPARARLFAAGDCTPD